MRILIPVFATVFAVQTPQCKNPFAPTTPPVTGPRSPNEYCAQFVGGFGEFFYCYSPQGNVWDPNMPSNWGGYCMQANTNSLGNVGYSAITFGGARFPVTSQSGAQTFCQGLANTRAADQCSSVIRCTR